MNIRNATLADIPSIMDLAANSSSAAHWTAEQYRNVFSAGETAPRLAIVAVENYQDAAIRPGANESLLAFLVARHLSPEWELENIIVTPPAQRKGIGKQLLGVLITAARETNSESVFLEVRESNTAARLLYERTGFQQTGRRKSYYSNPLEDAILYQLILS